MQKVFYEVSSSALKNCIINHSNRKRRDGAGRKNGIYPALGLAQRSADSPWERNIQLSAHICVRLGLSDKNSALPVTLSEDAKQYLTPYWG